MTTVHTEKGETMNNAEKFEKCFGIYATELWAMPEQDFLKWLSDEAKGKQWIPCEERLPDDGKDVAPVRHGHWIKISPAGIYECSECGKNVMTSDIEAYEYCHGCGARMDDDK